MNELRAEAVKKLTQLINNEVTAEEVSKWAETTYFKDENKVLIEESKSLSELFDDLSMASMTHDGLKLMYDKESFISWLNEYEEMYDEEKTTDFSK